MILSDFHRIGLERGVLVRFPAVSEKPPVLRWAHAQADECTVAEAVWISCCCQSRPLLVIMMMEMLLHPK